MYNPDFWEVTLDPDDLARFPNEAGIWFAHAEEEHPPRPDPLEALFEEVMDLIHSALTDKQRQVLLLYYMHQKTQAEVAQIMGISRRVVSQHLFGICRHGKHIGGAVKKLRRLCDRQGLELPTNGGLARPGASAIV